MNAKVIDVNDLQQQIGQSIRVRRQILKMTLEDLAAALHISYQQVQKYEQGTSRISAARLLDMSTILGVPITYFYEPYMQTHRPVSSEGLMIQESDIPPLTSPIREEHQELIQLYERLSPAMRQSLMNLIRAHFSHPPTSPEKYL